MPDTKSTYEPPIPSYDEAVGASHWPYNEAWSPAVDDDENREGHSLLHNAAPNSTNPGQRPDRHRSEGYRAPTVETDDEDSLFGAEGDSDTDDEAAHVRREMFEMDVIDAEHDDDRSSNFSALLWGKRIGFPLSLPRWRWSWRPRLPRMQIRLGEEGPSGREPARRTEGEEDSEESAPAPARWKRWCFPVAWPAFNNTALILVVGRLLAVALVLGFLYLLFVSDLFTGITRRMGSQMFDPESVRVHVQTSVDPLRMKENLREFTRYPHIAGTEGDYGFALDTRNRFVEYGLEDITVDQYYVYLNYPTAEGRAVEILGDDGQTVWSAQLEEQQADQPEAGHQTYVFHGHSKSGDVKGPLIYANYGTKEDFKALHDSAIDTRGAIALVRYRKGGEGDGALQVKAAEMAGFAGCIIYTDPASDGFAMGEGAARRDGVLRQAVSLTNWVVGDPLTPGWESIKNMPRLAKDKSPGLVQIPSLPLAWRDAEVLLQHLQGHGQRVPDEWNGAIPSAVYWTGNLSGPVVRLKNEQDEDEKKGIWNVYGRISGVEQSSKSVMIGNHRDAWTLGAASPGSGTAVFLELARIFGDLLKRGWRPLRTIEFMSWDGGEYNLAGSTEFVEKNTDSLRDDAVAYINLDAAVAGEEFRAAGSPVFRKLLLSVLNRVSGPYDNTTVREHFDARHGDIEPLGYDSDHVAFQDIAGTSSLDLSFKRSRDKFHSESGGSPAGSAYDNFNWMENAGDPDMSRHAMLGQIVGLMALELADRPILPFDMGAYARSLGGWVDEREAWSANKGANTKGAAPLDFGVLKVASAELTQKVAEFERWELEWEARIVASSGWESNGLGQGRQDYNDKMAHFETRLLDLENGGGIPNRTQFKHVVFGPPLWSADDGVHFPAIRDTILSGNWTLANQTVEKVARVIREAAKGLWDGR